MAIKVTLVNKSQITSNEVSVVSDDTLSLSRAIYQTLGSLVFNKNCMTVDELGSKTIDWSKFTGEYKEFVTDMNNLWQHTFYPELAIANGVPMPTEAIIKANEYLGSLGVTEEYFYSKDAKTIPLWIDIEKQFEYRVLTDHTDNTYLTDSNGTEVLVYYT